MAKVNINDVLQGLIQPIGSLKGGSTYPVTAADQIWVYTDHDTHRPLDEYLGAMKAEAAETTQTFVSNATALTDGKIAKASIVGGRAAKCKVSDIVLVADGNIYKISAIDETNITLALPALASYATAASLPRNRVLYGDLAATDEEFTGGGSSGGGSGGGGGATGGGSNNTLYPYNVHWNLYNESFELLIFKKEKLVNRTIKTVDELKELLDYPNNTHLLVHGTVKPSSTSAYNALVSDFIVKNSPSFSLIVYYRTWTSSGATVSFVLPVDSSSLAGITIYPLFNEN